MKIKLLILFITSFVIGNVSAQGNLQFNQILNEAFSASNQSSNNITVSLGTFIVPAGKVYKIESVSVFASSSSLLYTHSRPAAIGGQCVWTGPEDPVSFLPLWLSEGSYLIETRNIPSSGTTYNYRLNFSAIEFNIVP